MGTLLAHSLNWIRRCWSCLGPLGPRDRRCLRCGAGQPRGAQVPGG